MEKQIAFIFPGQGSQSVGMGFSLASRFPDFESLYNEYLKKADSVLGFSLSKIIQEGPAATLKNTEITQPALLTLSCAMADWLKKNDIIAQTALGHSLGEYSALVFAGTLTFEDAVQLVHSRGKFMTEAMPSSQGGMAALIGANREDAQKICEASREGDQVLEVSVVNCAGQVVISGHTDALRTAEQKAPDFGVRKVSILEVSGPFHCSLLSGAGEKLREELNKIDMKKPQLSVISNVTGQAQTEVAEIKENLVKQVSHTVLWADSVHNVGNEGTNEFIEVGSGKVLTGLMRKILPDAKCTALDAIQKLELLVA